MTRTDGRAEAKPSRMAIRPRRGRAPGPPGVGGAPRVPTAALILLILAVLAPATRATGDIRPEPGGRLLFLGVHPEAPAPPWALVGEVERAVVEELRLHTGYVVQIAVGAGPEEGLPSRPLAALRQAGQQLEQGLASYLGFRLEEAATLLAASFATYGANLPYLSEPQAMARAGLYLALVNLAAGREEDAGEVVGQLVRLGLDEDLPRSEFPPPLLPLLDDARAEATRQHAAALELDSRPPGALVFFDGHFRGRTPWSAAGLAPGEHGLRLERPGCLPLFRTVTLKGSQDGPQVLNVSMLRGRPGGGASRLLELRARGASAEEQEDEILRQAELVGADAAIVAFLRPAGPAADRWTLLLGLYRSERSLQLGLRELAVTNQAPDLAGLGPWVAQAMEAAPPAAAAHQRERFYLRPAGAAGSGDQTLDDEQKLRDTLEREGHALARQGRSTGLGGRFPFFLGLGTGMGWEEQDGGAALMVTPLVVDFQLHLLLSSHWALGLDGRGQLPPFDLLIEPQLRYRQQMGTLALHLFGGVPLTGMIRELRARTEGSVDEPERWAGLALGAALFRGWSSGWSLGVQLRSATLLPAFSFQLDLVLGALLGF